MLAESTRANAGYHSAPFPGLPRALDTLWNLVTGPLPTTVSGAPVLGRSSWSPSPARAHQAPLRSHTHLHQPLSDPDAAVTDAQGP